MKTTHKCLTLHGDYLQEGIPVSDGRVQFSPRWGMDRGDNSLLAATPADDGDLIMVMVAVTKYGPVLVVAEGVAERELVLVKQYHTGSGAKRYPGFHVELGEEVRRLSEDNTGGGSGSEHWLLVSAPLGWATNIAGQFDGRRDMPSQTVRYNPDHIPSQPGSVEKEAAPEAAPRPRYDERRWSSKEELPSSADSAMANALRKAGLI